MSAYVASNTNNNSGSGSSRAATEICGKRVFARSRAVKGQTAVAASIKGIATKMGVAIILSVCLCVAVQTEKIKTRKDAARNKCCHTDVLPTLTPRRRVALAQIVNYLRALRWTLKIPER